MMMISITTKKLRATWFLGGVVAEDQGGAHASFASSISDPRNMLWLGEILVAIFVEFCRAGPDRHPCSNGFWNFRPERPYLGWRKCCSGHRRESLDCGEKNVWEGEGVYICGLRLIL